MISDRSEYVNIFQGKGGISDWSECGNILQGKGGLGQ